LPVFASEGIAEQIFKAAIANEWVAFKIEKYVPWARLTQSGQTKSRDRLQPLIEDDTGGPALDLNARLFADTLKGARGAATGLEGQGDRHSRQPGAGGDRVFGGFSDLDLADARH
jgi:hypothetical protein